MSSAISRRLFLVTDRFRRQRMTAFANEFRPTAQTRILDVGGTETNWRFVALESQIVLLNLVVDQAAPPLPANITAVQGDGRDLPYDDGAFDICFSNSTIEHLHTLDNQQRFAAEIRRVGRSYYVQTPARGFPFEPHWLAFFIHWLPKRAQRRVARWGTAYGLVVKPTREEVDALIDEYRLLTRRELRTLFPDGEIRVERFLLLPKSYLAVRHG